MRHWNNTGKRGLALFLALLMCMNLLSLTAFADTELPEEPVGEEIIDPLPGDEDVGENKEPAPVIEENKEEDPQDEEELIDTEENLDEVSSNELLTAPFTVVDEPEPLDYDGECGAEANTVFYKLNGTELHIWGDGAMKTFGSWSNKSPWYGDGAGVTSVVIDNGVTSIGGYAFMNCTSLNNVTIPESVVSIEYYAFYGTGLTDVTVPNGVTSIGFDAFKDCSNLASVSLPNSLTELGSAAFARTALTNVTIPSGVTEIKDELFWNCKQLTNVTLPTGLTTIGKEAFRGTALGAVTLPDTVSTIKESAFYESGLTSINIPAGVTKIDTGVFHCCKNLSQITLPSELTEIGYLAFRETGLTGIVIPASVTNIGEQAFYGCKALN